MPLGNIPAANRLGVANVNYKSATQIAADVLRLPTDSPVYQQQLVHSTEATSGPVEGSADWLCKPLDSTEIDKQCVIREVSPYDFSHGRRNLSHVAWGGSPGTDLITHSASKSSQLYYLCNEPESASVQGTGAPCVASFLNGFGGWRVRDRLIDPWFANQINTSLFWNPNPPPTVPTEPAGYAVVKPQALAYALLCLKRDFEVRGHSILPPSAIGAFKVAPPSSTTPPSSPQSTPPFWGPPNNATWQFWQDFYDWVYNTTSWNLGGTGLYFGLSRPVLKAIHIHLYSSDPIDTYFGTPIDPSYNQPIPANPLTVAANDGTRLRKGIDWYRWRYFNNAPLPMDVLISEAGLSFGIGGDQDPHPKKERRWAGGFLDMRAGLSYWNTWLSYLTRNAAGQLNLEGWQSGSHVVYALMHEAEKWPYTTQAAPSAQTTHNQRFYNFDTSAPNVINSASGFNTTLNAVGRYPATFSSHGAQIVWPSAPTTWSRTPFGACLATWAKVAAKAVTEDINTGWISNTQFNGVIATGTTPALPSQFSTLYFPYIKDMATFIAGDKVEIQWQGDDGGWDTLGTFRFTDTNDSVTQTHNNISQPMYSAMILPVVVYRTGALVQRAFRMIRTYSGGGTPPRVWFGPPQQLFGACSWLPDPDALA